MKIPPLVTIVILNWNGYADTVECVNSVLKITYANYHIIIVDNGSANNEAQRLSSKYTANKKVSIIPHKKNAGFAGGVNIGIRESMKSNAAYTLLLNNDTVVDPHFLDRLLSVAEKDAAIGILSSQVFYYHDRKKVWFNGIYFNYFFPPLSKRYTGSSSTEVNDVVGCSMLIRNELFKKVGLFDEEYFAYGEESDFNYRATKQGYKLYIVPASHVWHKVSQSTGGGLNYTVAYLKMRNKIKYCKKNYPLKYYPSYGLFLFLYFMKLHLTAIRTRDLRIALAATKGVFDA